MRESWRKPALVLWASLNKQLQTTSLVLPWRKDLIIANILQQMRQLKNLCSIPLYHTLISKVIALVLSLLPSPSLILRTMTVKRPAVDVINIYAPCTFRMLAITTRYNFLYFVPLNKLFFSVSYLSQNLFCHLLKLVDYTLFSSVLLDCE